MLDNLSAFVGFMMAIAVFFGWYSHGLVRWRIRKAIHLLPSHTIAVIHVLAAVLQGALFFVVYDIAAEKYCGDDGFYDEVFLKKFAFRCVIITLIGYIPRSIYHPLKKFFQQEGIQTEYDTATRETGNEMGWID